LNVKSPFAGLLLAAVALAPLRGSPAPPADADKDIERWRLSIEGHRTFVFGDGRLGAGLRIRWRSEIRFVLKAGEFLSGRGESAWLKPVQKYSHPPGWFDCRLTDGTFLDRNLKLRHTPWVRYPEFAVAGRVSGEGVELLPAMGGPGNFIAVTYRCQSDSPIADNWFPFAARARQEGGRRQDASTGQEGDRRWAEIKEVRLIAPNSSLHLPLREGLVLALGDRDGLDRTEYRLQRLP
jgi:hypothetical protein